MRTIRARLAVGYAIALTATMFVFAATIYVIQRPERFDQLDPRLESEAELIVAMLSEAYARQGQVVVADTVRVDPETRLATTRAVLDPGVAALLESVQDYVLILSVDSIILYTTEAPRGLPSSTQLEQLADIARDPPERPSFGVVDIGQPAGVLRYYVRPLGGRAGPRVLSVFAGARTPLAVLTTGRLLVGMLASGPILLLASVFVGYMLAGRNIKPLDTIVDEIEAITDGRSLHRRVAPAESSSELARLSTTLNAMLVRLERNFLSLRRFTADASHELKTPLTVLRNAAERAITHPHVNPEVMEVLEEALVEVNRMTEIVESLLTLARVDEGRAPLHLEQIDFRALLAEIAETANILGEEAGIDVRVAVPREPIVLALDRGRARQLLLNLVTNAIKYTPRGGRVTITCVVRALSVSVTVEDTGIGIAPGDLPHVFDRFWRADAARSRTGERPGTGLGLAICKWIAEAHGGAIAVRSRRNQGTTFTVTLPRPELDQGTWDPSAP